MHSKDMLSNKKIKKHDARSRVHVVQLQGSSHDIQEWQEKKQYEEQYMYIYICMYVYIYIYACIYTIYVSYFYNNHNLFKRILHSSCLENNIFLFG